MVRYWEKIVSFCQCKKKFVHLGEKKGFSLEQKKTIGERWKLTRSFNLLADPNKPSICDWNLHFQSQSGLTLLIAVYNRSSVWLVAAELVTPSRCSQQEIWI